MYISIDRASCRFLHKHADVTTVANLDFIACKHEHTDVAPVTYLDKVLESMTDLELTKLYQHVTGASVPPYQGDSLRMLLAHYALEYPATEADPAEADKQAGHVEAQHPNGQPGLRYVRGSSVPGPETVATLFATCALLPPDQAAQVVHSRLVARAQRLQALAAATPAPVPPAPPAARSSAPRSVREPGAGSVTEQIFAECEKQLATGVSRDAARKLAIEELIKNGVNRNSAGKGSLMWLKKV
jgi:hypothetical protein